MKIDSMDAMNSIRNISHDSKSNGKSVKAGTKDNISVNSHTSTENKNISQLTSFDKKEMPISEKVVIDAIEKANKAISGANRRFEISIHEKTKEVMVKVIDSDTNEVVREIPQERILDMVAKMWEMAGLIVDERR